MSCALGVVRWPVLLVSIRPSPFCGIPAVGCDRRHCGRHPIEFLDEQVRCVQVNGQMGGMQKGNGGSIQRRGLSVRMNLSKNVLLAAVMVVAFITVMGIVLWPLVLRHVYVCDDLTNLHLPSRSFYSEQLKCGGAFDWNDEQLAGLFVSGEGQGGYYHPMHWVLYRILPLEMAFVLELTLVYPFAFLGMTLWLRRYFPHSAAPFFGGFVFAMGSFNVAHFVHPNMTWVNAHLPWLLWCIDILLRDRRRRPRVLAWAGLAVLTASQVLTGHPQMLWITLVGQLGFALFTIWWAPQSSPNSNSTALVETPVRTQGHHQALRVRPLLALSLLAAAYGFGALLGAEEFGFATAPLITQGCIMMRACHLNTCPVGIATQNKVLRKKFRGNADHLVNYFMFVAEEVRLLMARLGFRRLDEMVGQVDLLDVRPGVNHWKARGLDFSKILHRPQVAHAISWYQLQDHGLDKALDNRLIEEAKSALDRGEGVEIRSPIRNINRSVGVMLGAEVSRRHGADGLPEDTIRLTFEGVAGQSLAAFLPRGMTITVEGEANDYVGKGLSGGKVIVRVAQGATFDPAQNIIVGNVVLYGATSGEAYFGGRAGERFCVRNSGASAVAEGIGDHGCEYMTGGRVLILGTVGRNFAAGMSGGIAYVLDEGGELAGRCNMEMVELEALDADDEAQVFKLLSRHLLYTQSRQAGRLLDEFEARKGQIIKVMPIEYKRVLLAAQSKGGANG